MLRSNLFLFFCMLLCRGVKVNNVYKIIFVRYVNMFAFMFPVLRTPLKKQTIHSADFPREANHGAN
jgi:hypothetical protein